MRPISLHYRTFEFSWRNNRKPPEIRLKQRPLDSYRINLPSLAYSTRNQVGSSVLSCNVLMRRGEMQIGPTQAAGVIGGPFRWSGNLAISLYVVILMHVILAPVVRPGLNFLRDIAGIREVFRVYRCKYRRVEWLMLIIPLLKLLNM